MTPVHPGFFVPWLGYALFVAFAFRWETDAFLLLFILLRHCVTPSTIRLEREVLYFPIVMAMGIVIMMVSLLPVQKGYLRAIPVWILEALGTLVPISLLVTALGLWFYWIDLKYACV